MKPSIPIALLALALSSTPLQAAPGDTPAGSAPATPPERAVPNPAAAIQTDLARTLDPTTELIWLETGEEPKTLALSMPHNTAEKLGTVVILHDQRTSADWPELVSTLRKGLPDKGWATLSVQLPDAPYPEIPARELKQAVETAIAGGTPPRDNNTSDENTQSDMPTYSQQMGAISDAVFEMLQDNRQQRVVLGVGTGAVWATAMVRSREQSTRNLSLVLLDSRQPQHSQAPDLMTLLPELKSTTLDMYHGSTLTRDIAAGPRNRKNLATREKMDNYHQTRLPLLPGDWKKRNQWVLSRVRGFMQTHIVDPAEEKRSKRRRGRRYAGPPTEAGPGGPAPMEQQGTPVDFDSQMAGNKEKSI
ncbi:MAG: alpha/beta hydrolase family protein [Marinobacterium sp.]|nr:alpha/beta hydrolase family protein [Marinobacterium sp.]